MCVQVGYVAQQVAKRRSKRGYDPPTDPKFSQEWYLVSAGEGGEGGEGREEEMGEDVGGEGRGGEGGTVVQEEGERREGSGETSEPL